MIIRSPDPLASLDLPEATKTELRDSRWRATEAIWLTLGPQCPRTHPDWSPTSSRGFPSANHSCGSDHLETARLEIRAQNIATAQVQHWELCDLGPALTLAGFPGAAGREDQPDFIGFLGGICENKLMKAYTMPGSQKCSVNANFLPLTLKLLIFLEQAKNCIDSPHSSVSCCPLKQIHRPLEFWQSDC